MQARRHHRLSLRRPVPARGWIKPAVLFLLALGVGAIASVLWLARHPPNVATPDADATTDAVSLPARRALPAPAVGGRIDLPPPTAQAPDAPHIVPSEPVAPSAASPDTEPAMGAETQSDQAQQPLPPTPSDHDHGPRVSEQTPPRYPGQALRQRIEGTVRLTVSIDAQGNVTDVQIAHGSGSVLLDRAALDAVRDWRYQPAIHDGQPVPSTLEIPVDFRLNAQ